MARAPRAPGRGGGARRPPLPPGAPTAGTTPPERTILNEPPSQPTPTEVGPGAIAGGRSGVPGSWAGGPGGVIKADPVRGSGMKWTGAPVAPPPPVVYPSTFLPPTALPGVPQGMQDAVSNGLMGAPPPPSLGDNGGADPGGADTDAGEDGGEQGDVVDRDPPDPEVQRRALVRRWNDKLVQAKQFWKPVFDRMDEDQDFAAGVQWPGQRVWRNDERYVCNIVLRHIAQRVATLYARLPKVTAKRRPKLDLVAWDGKPQSLIQAQQAVQMGMPDPTSLAIIQEAMQAKADRTLRDRMARTLELMFTYSLEEQTLPFKTMMKMAVRRTVTTGVGYVKLGFQRAMERRPEVTREIADISERLSTMQQLGADIADGIFQPDSAEAEQLRLLMQDLKKQEFIVTREGLTFDYPMSTAIIPDPQMKSLREFVGCDWVAEQYLLTREQIQQVYGKDVGTQYTQYGKPTVGTSTQTQSALGPSVPQARIPGSLGGDNGALFPPLACIWEIYNRADGLVYVVCDGYPDFLQEPEAPEIYIERFWPWFSFIINETDHRDYAFPISDVRLMRDMQVEMNRARQGLREHRHANRPKTVTAAGVLDDDDKEKLVHHPANAVIELLGLQPGQDVKTLLQAYTGPGIDMNLYQTSEALADVQLAIGAQAANLGPVEGKGTATETSIAQQSHVATEDEAKSDMDDMLTAIARAAGQILLMNVSQETAIQQCGPAAVWPEESALDVAKELLLEVEAGSAGRPNAQQNIQAITQLVPLLLQVPGITPTWVAKQILTQLDNQVDLEDAIVDGLPSIAVMNQMAQNGMNPPGPPGMGAPGAPGALPPGAGPGGPQNTPQAPGPGGPGPRTPNPRPVGPPPGAPLPN